MMMTQPAAAKARSSYELWQDTIDGSLKDPRWHLYDCDLQRIVAEFNRHLSGKGGYFPLDWRIIKAMVWTESGGPNNPAWHNNPMQIGNSGDPGLAALFKKLNPGAFFLKPGQTLKYHKAALQKIIVGWNLVTTSTVAARYNVGDPAYAKKLNYCLSTMRKSAVNGDGCAP